MHTSLQKCLPTYLCCGKTIADGEAIDCDLDLALVDHVDDSLGCCVHGDDGHGQSSICISSSFLVVVTFHLIKEKTLNFHHLVHQIIKVVFLKQNTVHKEYSKGLEGYLDHFYIW